ncbi:MAG: cellulase family glycosylhydrolase [Acidobacteriaceae bacterium]
MRAFFRFLLPAVSFGVPLFSLAATTASTTVVFWQPGFPVADAPAPTEAALHAAFSDADFADAQGLPSALNKADLLVLPYGSAWPEADWDAILEYLDRGGNLMVLGGKAFTRAAYQDGSGWQLRSESVAQTLELFIDGYQETPGTSGDGAVTFAANPDVFPQLPAFGWKRAFSPVVRLSVVNDDSSGGATGGEDMDLTTLAWGERDGHKLAAPVIQLDHNANRFVGGRWILVACDPDGDFFSNTKLLAMLAAMALEKNDRFTFRPRVPLFVAGEALDFRFKPSDPMAEQPAGDQLRVRVTDEAGAVLYDQTAAFPDAHRLALPASAAGGRGFHTVEATLIRDGKPVRIDRSGYWMRDWNYLLSGPKLGVGPDYFTLDGKPLPVVGTTYMSGDVARMYLMKPNAHVWDQDMAQIHGAGLNMIRTGLWTAWAKELAPNGQMTENALRTVEAFLMCARHNGLPVQFNLFAFYPDTFGGENGYLDPVALAAESRYAESIVARFGGVPFLAWDLINEPSANKNLWRTLPDYDPFEQAAWRKWLAERYPDPAKLLHDWAEPSLGIGRDLQASPTAMGPEIAGQDPLALPKAQAFSPDAVRSGFNPLKDYDYALFTQWLFDGWVKKLRAMIRGMGSQQLITVGQDEGGVAGRLSPAFYGPEVDFTADHTWWDYDAILWASLAPKFPGKPLLIQETGEQRRMQMDGQLRLSAEQEGWQLERKIAIAFAQGAGALEWVWNVNAYMANDNEVPIGAVRPDGTEKPEAQVLAGYAAFATKSPQSFTKIIPPDVTMVTSQTLLYSILGELGWDTQKKALRAMAYDDHMPLRLLPENRLADLESPKLVLLPSPQGLTDAAWAELMAYVERGGTLLVTGPVDRDEHWQPVDRLTPLGVKGDVVPLEVRGSTLTLPGGMSFALGFPASVQQSETWTQRFTTGKSVAVIAHGSGKILWTADPVEFADGYDATSALYRWALEQAGVQPVLQAKEPLSPDVLALPTELEDGVVYSFSNESDAVERIDFVDARTGAHVNFTMDPQRGAALLLDLQGRALASYGGAAVVP